MSVGLKPTGENGMFLNKKDGPHGVFYSKNLTPNAGKNYVTINVAADGTLATIKVGQGEVVPLKANSTGKGYNAVVDGLRVFAHERTTPYGDAISLTVTENKPQAKEQNSAEDESFEGSNNSYGGNKKSFSRS